MTPAELDAIKARREDFRTPYSVSVKDVDALLAYVDELEQRLSDLTRELEAKNRRLIALESRPVSAPPGLDPRTAPKGYPLGWTQHADGEYDPKRVAEAYDALRRWHVDFTREEAERRLNDWSGRARLTGADVGMVLALFPEAGETEGPEVAAAVDADLNGHEPTPFAGGAA